MRELIEQLDSVRNELRHEAQSASTPCDPSERIPEYVWISLPGTLIGRLWRTAYSASRTIAQLTDRLEKAERRASQLSSSNAALMVDRDRGIQAANDRAHAAEIWAVDMARTAGMGDSDILDEAKKRFEYDREQWTALEQERDRLESFRTFGVSMLTSLESHSSGLTGDQVTQLIKHIKKANNKALGR